MPDKDSTLTLFIILVIIFPIQEMWLVFIILLAADSI